MGDDNMQNDVNRRKKVERFQLNIKDDDFDDLPDTDLYSDYRSPQEDSGDFEKVIHSYSDPEAAQRDRTLQREAEARAEKEHRWRNRKKRKMNRFLFRFMWFFMVLFLSVLLSQLAIGGFDDMLAKDREKVSVTVEIPKNPTTDQVAQILKDAGVIRETDFFKLYSKLTKADGHYHNGSYKIDTNMDYEAIINSLQTNSNRVDTIKITFPEGMNAVEIAALLEKNGVCTAKDALAVMNSNNFDSGFEIIKSITNAKDRYYKLEGYLFPDTYEFYKDEDPKSVVKKLLNNCNKKLTAEIRNKAAAEKMTVDQMMVLASMIQAEAANKEDMYRISSVFHNRLASSKGDLSRLRSDPTTYYPYRTKAAVPSNLRDTYKSKYDTYTIVGLPAGPICNPGAEAIDAALNPANTDYYYFCHDKDGKAYYAKTNAGHEANLVKAGLK